MAYSPMTRLLSTLNWILDSVSKISWLWWAQNSLNRLQVSVDNTPAVTISSGTVTTVSTVTTCATVTTCSTLTNQTNIGWYWAQNQIPALMNMEATLANIDNIYIS